MKQSAILLQFRQSPNLIQLDEGSFRYRSRQYINSSLRVMCPIAAVLLPPYVATLTAAVVVVVLVVVVVVGVVVIVV